MSRNTTSALAVFWGAKIPPFSHPPLPLPPPVEPRISSHQHPPFRKPIPPPFWPFKKSKKRVKICLIIYYLDIAPKGVKKGVKMGYFGDSQKIAHFDP